MDKRWKIGFKIMPYGLNCTRQLIFCVIILIVGAALEIYQVITGFDGMHRNFYGENMGSLFLLIGGTFLSQFMLAPMRSTWLRTSSYNKIIQTKLSPLYNLIGTGIGFTICVIGDVIMSVRFPETITFIKADLCLVSICSALVLIYGAIAFKFYILSILTLYACIILGVVVDLGKLADRLPEHIGVVIVGGYLILMIGWGIHVAIVRLLYKYDLSCLAFTTAWQRGNN